MIANFGLTCGRILRPSGASFKSLEDNYKDHTQDEVQATFPKMLPMMP